MGFQLPENPDVTQLAYYLVAIPDDPVYKRAAIGHFGELGSARVWGEEGVSPSSFIAAQSWLRALNETWELLQMGWPQLVIDHIDEIEALLKALQFVQEVTTICCGDNVTYEDPPGGFADGEDVPQAVIDAGFATGPTDYAGYQAYKCMAAHLLINNFQSKAIKLGDIVQAGAAILSGLLILFGAISGIGTAVIFGLTVGIGDLVSLVDALKDITQLDLLNFAEDLEEDRDELVCAIMAGDGITDAIAQYKAKLDELYSDVQAGILKLLNVDHMFQHYLAAAYGNVDVAAELAAAEFDPADYSCPCGHDVVITFRFDADTQGGQGVQSAGWNSDCQCAYVGRYSGIDSKISWRALDINTHASDGAFVAGRQYKLKVVRAKWGNRVAGQNVVFRFNTRIGTSMTPWLSNINSNGFPTGCPSETMEIAVAGIGNTNVNALTDPIFEIQSTAQGNTDILFDNLFMAWDDVTP